MQQLSQPGPAVFGADPARNRDAMLIDTLRAAGEKLTALQGPDMTQWSWGALHRVSFRHPLDPSRGAAALFDRGPIPRSGDGDVVQATSFGDASFDQISGASYREIFDLADWDKSVAINVPGQSGQPGSKHYDDLLPLWSKGQYFPLNYSKAAVDGATTDVLLLAP
jgi:penicillin amidase